jgi:ABC-type transporter Mla maintaining outer membrane lipid asymmetry ATPase subunit MlaF
MIEVKNVSKKFDSLIVLDNVSFNVDDARLIVILGPSGTGKTVLLKAILGLMSVDSGEVLLLDNIALPIVEHTSASTSEVKDKVTQILEIIGMSGKEKLYPRSLSGGMKRLVAVGRALALDPKYLFYDEPTTGLDPIMRDRVVKLIIDLKKNHAKSGIVVTHDLDTAKAVGDEIYMLKRGKISKLKQIKKEVYNG